MAFIRNNNLGGCRRQNEFRLHASWDPCGPTPRGKCVDRHWSSPLSDGGGAGGARGGSSGSGPFATVPVPCGKCVDRHWSVPSDGVLPCGLLLVMRRRRRLGVALRPRGRRLLALWPSASRRSSSAGLGDVPTAKAATAPTAVPGSAVAVTSRRSSSAGRGVVPAAQAKGIPTAASGSAWLFGWTRRRPSGDGGGCIGFGLCRGGKGGSSARLFGWTRCPPYFSATSRSGPSSGCSAVPAELGGACHGLCLELVGSGASSRGCAFAGGSPGRCDRAGAL